MINLKKCGSSKNKRCYKIWNQAIQNKISLLQVTQFTVCLFTFFCFKVSATFSNFCEIFCSTEWFQQQKEFTNELKNMEVDELNKCLAKFYVSVRKTDGSL